MAKLKQFFTVGHTDEEGAYLTPGDMVKLISTVPLVIAVIVITLNIVLP